VSASVVILILAAPFLLLCGISGIFAAPTVRERWTKAGLGVVTVALLIAVYAASRMFEHIWRWTGLRAMPSLWIDGGLVAGGAVLAISMAAATPSQDLGFRYPRSTTRSQGSLRSSPACNLAHSSRVAPST
jgi:hypothetical protein